MFNKADLGGVDDACEGDGKVTLNEIISNVEGVDDDADQALFNAVDANGDGYVTYNEFATFVQLYLMQQMNASNGSNGSALAQIADSIRTLILSDK